MPDKVLVYDCFSGISGDMHIGAMLDLGVPVEYLKGELARLSMAGEFDLEVTSDSKLGISGTRATVTIGQPQSDRAHRVRRAGRVLVRQVLKQLVERRAISGRIEIDGQR